MHACMHACKCHVHDDDYYYYYYEYYYDYYYDYYDDDCYYDHYHYYYYCAEWEIYGRKTFVFTTLQCSRK